MRPVEFSRLKALRYLEERYLGRPGYVNIVCSSNWAGQCFATDQDGLTDAVNYAAWLDAMKPKGVYFRISTLRDIPPRGKRGERNDTLWWPGPFGDVDYGSIGHEGSNLPPDVRDAQRVIEDSGCPAVTDMISSGGGLYPMWQVSDGLLLQTEADLDAAEALSVMVSKKLLYGGLLNGYVYGDGVHDLPRVFRLPGSVNRKRPDIPRVCEVIAGTRQPVAVADFTAPDAERLLQLQREMAAKGVGVKAPRPPRKPSAPRDPNAPLKPLDVLDELMDWPELLGLFDLHLVGADSVGDRYLREGSSSAHSLRVMHATPCVVNWSETLAPPVGVGLAKGEFLAWMTGYNGECGDMLRDLFAGTNPGNIPQTVIDAMASAGSDNFFGIKVTTIRSSTLQTVPGDSADTADIAEVSSGLATEEELAHLFSAYTRCLAPERLDHRIGWAMGDPVQRLPAHAVRLIEDVVSGLYAAPRAYLGFLAACRRHGVSEASAQTVFAAALGKILNARMAEAQ